MCLILHTNDFHNKLTQEKALKIRQKKLGCQDSVLLLDAGDAISSGNVDYHLNGEPILDLMSDCGYMAMTMGNREFHFSKVGLRCKLARAHFPVLCANIYPKGHAPITVQSCFAPLDANLPLQAAFVFDLSQWKILVIGFSVPMITPKMISRCVSAYLFEDPLRAAQRLIPTLQETVQPDLTIALTHVGLAKDHQLAQLVPSIDLIVGGHTHELLPNGEWIGDTLIVQAGCYAKHLGCVEWTPHFKKGDRARLVAGVEPL